jgi:ankyrin repeat protein
LRTHSKQFECKLCPKRFANPADLRRHSINSKAHRVGIQVFRCRFVTCEFAVSRKDNLLQHIRTVHPSERQQWNANSTSVDGTAHPPGDGSLQDDIIKDPIDSGFTEGWQVMMSAATTGDVQVLIRMIGHGLDINTTAEDGSTALHCAARAGQVETVLYLIQNQAEIESKNPMAKGRRPIHEAILGKHVTVFKSLLQAGADMVTADGAGNSITDYVGRVGDTSLAEALLQRKKGRPEAVELAKQLMFSLVRSGSSALAWLILAYPEIETCSNHLRSSLLYSAAKSGSTDLFKQLLARSKVQYGSNHVFVKNVNLSLLWAARAGHDTIVEVLVQYENIDINAKNTYGYTALQLAADRGNIETVILLLGHASIQSRNESGLSAISLAFLGMKWEIFHILAEHEGISTEQEFNLSKGEVTTINGKHIWLIAKYLLEQRDLATVSAYRWYRIMAQAAQSGWTDLIRLLNDQSGFHMEWVVSIWGGASAMHVAIQHHQNETLKAFLDHPSISGNIKERRYYTPGQMGDHLLHYAIRHDNMIALEMLLAGDDIDITLRNNDNQTALDFAISMDRREMADAILECSNRPLLADRDVITTTTAAVESTYTDFTHCSDDQYTQNLGDQSTAGPAGYFWTTFDGQGYVEDDLDMVDWDEEEHV